MTCTGNITARVGTGEEEWVVVGVVVGRGARGKDLCPPQMI